MDRYFLEKANANSKRLFMPRNGRPQLKQLTIDKIGQNVGEWCLAAQPQQSINSATELEEASIEGPNEQARLYTIQHERSWSPLNISWELFNRLIELHQVFPEIWRVVLTFGFKSFENEYGFPTPQSRESRLDSADIQEVAYVLRRVERNRRPPPECPWSIRQTGVYQKLSHRGSEASGSNSVFLLIAPSSTAEDDVAERLALKAPEDVEAATSAFSVHECLVTESLRGWMDYLCWLEEQLKLKSTRMMATPLNGGPETRSINFVENDRRSLKELEFRISDILVILHTKIDTIHRLKRVCKQQCRLACRATALCSCHRTVERFEEYASEAQSYQERAKVLQSRVQSVQNLLSDLLGYEEVRALRDLARASNQESADIKKLTMRTVQDATAVRLLTIIGLVFLPTTMVENFFSTEFVKTENGGLQISKYVWVMVAVAVPLTAFVLACWRVWLRCEYSQLHPCTLAKQGLKELLRRRNTKTTEPASPV
ncbi:uncharacterized protein BDV17DRAFT_81403 [Aspergillus undulatus]|uniref:uncharacterized protein n=1 Tax=Aspergillus undulatus TaxID=1810928 RepID=UPI003CCD1BDE